MTNKEIENILKIREDITVAYDHAPKGTKVPFITFATSSDNFFADDVTYKKAKSLRIVLYTSQKDEALEKLLEDALDKEYIPYNDTGNFSDDESVYMKIYESEVF